MTTQLLFSLPSPDTRIGRLNRSQLHSIKLKNNTVFDIKKIFLHKMPHKFLKLFIY